MGGRRGGLKGEWSDSRPLSANTWARGKTPIPGRRRVATDPAYFQRRTLPPTHPRLVPEHSSCQAPPSPGAAPLRAGGGGAPAVLSVSVLRTQPSGTRCRTRAPASLQASPRPGPAGPAPWEEPGAGPRLTQGLPAGPAQEGPGLRREEPRRCDLPPSTPSKSSCSRSVAPAESRAFSSEELRSPRAQPRGSPPQPRGPPGPCSPGAAAELSRDRDRSPRGEWIQAGGSGTWAGWPC